MKKTSILAAMMCLLLCLSGCRNKEESRVVLHRDFFENTWERFDYVENRVEIKEATTFDLSMKVSFTEAYPYDDFSMVFTVFEAEDAPYRSKGYTFSLKDADGQWKSEAVNGIYTFELPINRELRLSDAGTYTFRVEYRMPITPLIGISQLTLSRK